MQQQEQFIEKDIRKLEKILDHLIETNKALAAAGEVPVSLEIIGEAGIGKTSICAQAAARHDMEFVKIQLSQFDDLGDFTGFPSRAFEVTKGSETLYVKEKVLDVYLNNSYVLTGNDASINCPPKWLAGKTSPLVVLIDDWTRAQPRFQQAMMEFILFQTYGDNRLPSGSTVLLTSNPDNRDYLVNPVDPAMRSRFGTVSLKFSIDAWSEWAERSGVDSRCINFFLLNKDIYDPHAPAGSPKQRVNPRSLTLFFKAISSIEDYDTPQALTMIKDLGEAYLTKEVASLFATFVSGHLDKIPDGKTLLQSDNPVNLISSAVTKEGKTSSAIAFVISTRIYNYLKWCKEEATINKDEVLRLGEILKSRVLPVDISLNLIKKSNALDKTAFAPWFLDKELRELILKK